MLRWLLLNILALFVATAMPNEHEYEAHKHVPILSVSLNADPKNYISRLIRSIDHDVQLFVLQIGNKDPEVVKNITINAEEILSKTRFVHNFKITKLPYNPGESDVDSSLFTKYNHYYRTL